MTLKDIKLIRYDFRGFAYHTSRGHEEKFSVKCYVYYTFAIAYRICLYRLALCAEVFTWCIPVGTVRFISLLIQTNSRRSFNRRYYEMYCFCHARTEGMIVKFISDVGCRIHCSNFMFSKHLSTVS